MTDGLAGGCVKSLGAWQPVPPQPVPPVSVMWAQLVPVLMVRQIPRFADEQAGFAMPGNSRAPATTVVELTTARSEMKHPLNVVPPTLTQLTPPLIEW